MTTTTILSDNGASSGSAGLKTTGGNDGKLQLQTTTSGGTATTALTIDTSQNVGIGTSLPVQRLSVWTNAGTSSYIEAKSGSYASVLYGQNNAGDAYVYNAEAANIRLFTSATERMRIDSSGNVGIGTSSPGDKLEVVGSVLLPSDVAYKGKGSGGTARNLISMGSDDNHNAFAGTLSWRVLKQDASAEFLKVDTSANLYMNSGYGSVAKAYGCRAWVNFNGTGTVAIRASGNVSSITDNGTGNYTVNFTSAMPDASYAFAFGGTDSIGDTAFPNFDTGQNGTVSTTQLQVRSDYQGTAYDMIRVCVSIFR